MNRAAEETLKALGLERHQALIVAHRDKDHPHLHMIANRVNPETGKAAKLGNDRLKLSRWAERWERERGQVKCPERAKNNAERAKGGRFVRDRKSLHTARHRRERMRKAGPVREVGPRVWLHKPAHLEKWASMEREAFRQYQQARGPVLEALARDCRQAWRWQYEEQKADVAAVEKLAGGDVRDRLRLARIAGDGDWRRIRQERDRPRRGGFGRKLRGAWKEARALGVRAAVGAVRSDPAELKRLAMAKLERGHWRARARIGQHHTYKAVAAETRGGSCVRPGGRGGAPGRPRYAGRGAAGARSRPAATASTDARSRPEPRPWRRLRALTLPPDSLPPPCEPTIVRSRPVVRPVAFPKYPERVPLGCVRDVQPMALGRSSPLFRQEFFSSGESPSRGPGADIPRAGRRPVALAQRDPPRLISLWDDRLNVVR